MGEGSGIGRGALDYGDLVMCVVVENVGLEGVVVNMQINCVDGYWWRGVAVEDVA